jgi:hypothetical protein
MPLSAQTKDRLLLLLAASGVAIVALAAIWATLVLVPEQYSERIDWKWARFGLAWIPTPDVRPNNGSS